MRARASLNNLLSSKIHERRKTKEGAGSNCDSEGGRRVRGWRERENDEPRITRRGEERRFHLDSFQEDSFCKPKRGKKAGPILQNIISDELAAGENSQDERLKSERERDGRSRKGKKKEEEGGC